MRHTKRRTHRRRSHGMRRRGGFSGAANPASYSSAASFALATLGDTNTQYRNVYGMHAKHHPNAVQGLQSQWAGKRGRRSSKKRGGMWGQVINQAVVPFGLLGMQQSYGKKRRGGTRRHRRH